MSLTFGYCICYILRCCVSGIFINNYMQICVYILWINFAENSPFCVLCGKGTPAWKKYTTASGGGGDKYQVWLQVDILGRSSFLPRWVCFEKFSENYYCTWFYVKGWQSFGTEDCLVPPLELLNSGLWLIQESNFLVVLAISGVDWREVYLPPPPPSLLTDKINCGHSPVTCYHLCPHTLLEIQTCREKGQTCPNPALKDWCIRCRHHIRIFGSGKVLSALLP